MESSQQKPGIEGKSCSLFSPDRTILGVMAARTRKDMSLERCSEEEKEIKEKWAWVWRLLFQMWFLQILKDAKSWDLYQPKPFYQSLSLWMRRDGKGQLKRFWLCISTFQFLGIAPNQRIETESPRNRNCISIRGRAAVREASCYTCNHCQERNPHACSWFQHWIFKNIWMFMMRWLISRAAKIC